jgi:hypothetical protein
MDIHPVARGASPDALFERVEGRWSALRLG